MALGVVKNAYEGNFYYQGAVVVCPHSYNPYE